MEINAGHRTILIDWLSDVGLKFKLLTETLFLTVWIMDKYLSTKPGVARKKLQLVGTTSMLVAAKYEEIYTPEVKDYAWITGHA
jgi:cyclin B